MMPRLLPALFTLHFSLLTASAQEPAAVLAAFKEERAAAAKADPAADLRAADALAAKAEEALKANNPAAAGRLARDARWLLPAAPVGLPPHVEKVIGYVRLRHADRVNAVAYFPDGRRLASAGRDGSVRVWNLDNGRELAAYRKFPAPAGDKKEDDNVLRVPSVAVLPDGQTVAAAGGAEVHLWNPTTDAVRVLKTGEKSVWAVAFHPNGKSLATVAGDKVVRLWDAAAGTETVAFPPLAARVEALAFSPDGALLAAADDTGTLTVYATDGGDKKPKHAARVTEAADQPARAVAFTADGKVFTGGEDKTPRLSTPAGAALVRFPGHTNRVAAVAVAGPLLLSAGDDKSVRVWDATSGKLVRQYQGHVGPVTALAVRPDGKQFASAADDGGIRLWDLSAADDHRSASDATDHLWAAAFSPDGSRFAAAGADRVVRVYDAATHKLLHALKGHTAAVTSLAFLPDGRLASAGGDRVVRLWNADGSSAGTLDGHTSAVLALAAGPTGLLVSGAADKTVRGWDAKAGKPLWAWNGRSPAAAVAVRPDGKRVAVGSADGSLTLLDVTSPDPKPLHTVAGHLAGVAAAAFTPDGAGLATAGGDGLAKLWAVPPDGAPTARNFDTGVRPTQPGMSVALSAVAVSPDGRFLAAAGADGVVHVWSAVTGVEVRALRGHADWVTAVAFAPAGDGLLAAGVDRTARLFELPKSDGGRAGHAAAARAVAVSRDGKWLLSGSDDKTVKLWALPAGTETATLPGSVLPTLAVAFLGPDRAVAGTEDGLLKAFGVPTPGEPTAVPAAGSVCILTPAADGSRLGVWVRKDRALDEFRWLTADLKPAGEPLVVKDADVQCGAFAPGLARVAVGTGKGTVRFYDLATRERAGDDWGAFHKAKPEDADRAVGDLAFTPDGKFVVTASPDGVVKVGEVAGRKDVAAGTGPANGVLGVVASPAGGRFAVLGSDGDVRVYDLSAKEQRGWKLPVPANAAAFTPDGKRLVTANADGTLYVLGLP